MNTLPIETVEILSYINDCAEDEDPGVTVNLFVDAYDMDEKVVRKALAHLTEKGLVRKVVSYKNNRRNGFVYVAARTWMDR